MTDNQKRHWWQFRISTILLLTVIVGLGVGWWVDHGRQVRGREAMIAQREWYRREIQQLKDTIKRNEMMNERLLRAVRHGYDQLQIDVEAGEPDH